MNLVFVTRNKNKVKEIEALLTGIKLLSLDDVGIEEEIPEESPTIEGNALAKAEYVYKRKKLNVFADDTGLEIDALNGEPGVNSAHYSGERNDNANIQKVLSCLGKSLSRKAQFKTVICLFFEGKKHLFEGICKGKIALAPSGNKGFGYDSIFIPESHNQTFAEMGLAEKNRISHRSKALEKMISFLNEFNALQKPNG